MGRWPGARSRGAPRGLAGPALRALPVAPSLAVLGGLEAPPGAGLTGKGSWPSGRQHLAPGRRVQRVLGGQEEGEQEPGTRAPGVAGTLLTTGGVGLRACLAVWERQRPQRALAGEVPFPSLYREGSSRLQLGPILFVRLSCRE